MSQATHRLVLVVEGPSDERRARILLDHWILEQVDWVDASTLDTYRHYTGLELGEEWLDLHDIPKLARAQRLRPSGHGEAWLVRGLLLPLLLEKHRRARLQGDESLVVVYLRDTDGFPERQPQAERGATGLLGTSALSWLPGFPHEAMEAWVLLGWLPGDEAERAAHQAAMKALSFDPLKTPHTLSHKENVPKSAKALLERLGVDHTREETCLARAADREDDTAEQCGLGAFRRKVLVWLHRTT